MSLVKKTYKEIAEELGELVTEKDKAYGRSWEDSETFLRLLFPSGIPSESYTDALLLVRVFDKMKRIATKKDAFGESPFRDIAGYGILGAFKDQKGDEAVVEEGTEGDTRIAPLPCPCGATFLHKHRVETLNMWKMQEEARREVGEGKP